MWKALVSILVEIEEFCFSDKKFALKKDTKQTFPVGNLSEKQTAAEILKHF
jgi:hypothetical protein